MRILRRISTLLSRPDFRRNPLRAIYRRLFWRLRWKYTQSPWVLHLHRSDYLITPKSGAGALIYYQGCSEPATTQFLCHFLKEGMVFVDVGAHIGEYVILASRRVGMAGEVHAFEPQPQLAELLARSLELNGIANCVLNRAAALNIDGTVELEIPNELSRAVVRVGPERRRAVGASKLVVPSIRLDTYRAQRISNRRVDLIKIDVEGAELLVLQGAYEVLQQGPVIVLEYAEHNMRSFGYDGATLLAFLQRLGYHAFEFRVAGGHPILHPIDEESRGQLTGTVNLIATTDAEWLSGRLTV